MTPTPTPDPLTALAAELGRIGQRLDGMGVELMTLRDGMGAAGRPSPPEGRTVALRGEVGATSGHGGPAQGLPISPPAGDGVFLVMDHLANAAALSTYSWPPRTSTTGLTGAN